MDFSFQQGKTNGKHNKLANPLSILEDVAAEKNKYGKR